MGKEVSTAIIYIEHLNHSLHLLGTPAWKVPSTITLISHIYYKEDYIIVASECIQYLYFILWVIHYL
jgi:hypothetical protein